MGNSVRNLAVLIVVAALAWSDLVTAGLLPSAEVRDEWHRAVLVESRGDQLVVRGLGADGQRGTDDDWVLVR